jgi:hypothetical protein
MSEVALDRIPEAARKRAERLRLGLRVATEIGCDVLGLSADDRANMLARPLRSLLAK